MERKEAEGESKEDDSSSKDPSLVRLTKAEKRLKLKRSKKEAKKQSKEEVQQTPQAEVLVRVCCSRISFGFNYTYCTLVSFHVAMCTKREYKCTGRNKLLAPIA